MHSEEVESCWRFASRTLLASSMPNAFATAARFTVADPAATNHTSCVVVAVVVVAVVVVALLLLQSSASPHVSLVATDRNQHLMTAGAETPHAACRVTGFVGGFCEEYGQGLSAV
jgi:hypothetical protein